MRKFYSFRTFRCLELGLYHLDYAQNEAGGRI
jgi:hypothetical protein